MSNHRASRSRAIVLGLSITSMGAQAVVAADLPIADAHVDLAGLVAVDAAAAPVLRWSEPGIDAVAGVEGCDPSGCSAYFRISEFGFGDVSNSGYGDLSTALLVAQRSSGSTVVDPQVDIVADSGAQIVVAPGCEFVGQQRVICALGDMVDQTPKALTITTRAGSSSSYRLNASIYSAVTTNTGPSTAQAYAYTDANGSTAMLRMTRIAQSMCPYGELDAALVTASGEPAWSGLAQETPRLLENGTFVASMFDATQPLLSIALALDDSAAVDAATWQAARSAAALFLQDWASWASSNGQAMPSVAVYGMASSVRLLDYSTDANAMAAAIQALPQQPLGTAVYETLDLASEELAARSGRRAVVMLATGKDADGARGREALRMNLAGRDVNIYGVAIDTALEPLVRDLASISSGFRQRADLDGGSPVSLDRVARHLRSLRKVTWVSPFAMASSRPVALTVDGGFFWGSAEGRYTPTGPACVAACRVSRSLPAQTGPAMPFPVSLQVTPSPDQPITVTERLPENMGVSAISGGGIFDPATSTIAWTVAAGVTPISLHYTLDGSTSLGARLEFAGSFGNGGVSGGICGDARVGVIGLFPGQRYQYSVDRPYLLAYERAWLYGAPWFGPANNLVRAAFVTRGKQMERAQSVPGSVFSYFPSADVPWASTGPGVVMATPQSSYRLLPASFIAGVSFPVLLGYTSSHAAGAGVIEEVPPAGWAIGNISDGGVYDPLSHTIRWGVFTGTIQRSVSYTLIAPAGAAASAVFKGWAVVDGNESAFPETSFGVPGTDVIFRSGFDGN